MRSPARLLISCFFLLLSAAASAQSANARGDLEKKRREILEAIRITEQQLETIKKDKSVSLSQLKALQNKLAERQRLIRNINDEIAALNQNITFSAQEVQQLQNDLITLKLKYAQSVRYAYKSRSSYSMLAFLFSATDFNNAVRRLRYLKQYRDFRKKQADQIRLTQSQIQQKIGLLSLQKAQKSILLTTEEQQKQVILKETNEQNRVVLELKGQEKKLLADIDRNRKAARQVDASIAKVIQREIELARRKAEEDEKRRRAENERRREEAKRQAALANQNKSNLNVATGSGIRPANPTQKNNTPDPGKTSNPPTEINRDIAVNTPPRTEPKPLTNSYIDNLTPEASALSTNFENNQGRLPYPVEKGYIAQGFGVYRHPVLKHISLENAGVTINTNQGSAARAVFDGEVSSVFNVPGVGWIVTIKHGLYFSVYSGLSSASVTKDQTVHTKQVIGTVGENEEGITALNFQIWKVLRNNNTTKLNPAAWLAR